jgi:hypothetical protein
MTAFYSGKVSILDISVKNKKKNIVKKKID